MGLDVSHDAWHGAYSAFSRWRTALARAAGGDLWYTTPGMAYFTYEQDNFTPDEEAGFRTLMGHSDCDGEISAEMCANVAAALERILPNLTEEEAGGHMPSVKDKTEQFIEGCRVAYDSGDPLIFA